MKCASVYIFSFSCICDMSVNCAQMCVCVCVCQCPYIRKTEKDVRFLFPSFSALLLLDRVFHLSRTRLVVSCGS